MMERPWTIGCHVFSERFDQDLSSWSKKYLPIIKGIPSYLPRYNTHTEQPRRFVTIETFHQSDQETWSYQKIWQCTFRKHIFQKCIFESVFLQIIPSKSCKSVYVKVSRKLLPNSQISHKLEYILNVTHLQQISISFVKSNPSWLRSFLVSNGPLAMVCFDLKYQGQYKFFERWSSFPVPRYLGIGIQKGTVVK